MDGQVFGTAIIPESNGPIRPSEATGEFRPVPVSSRYSNSGLLTKWSTLRAWGMNVAKRRGVARARVAVARKLAVILHRMWADGSEFRWGQADRRAGSDCMTRGVPVSA
jgi:hypothetical protein